jgi:hypothetical protein
MSISVDITEEDDNREKILCMSKMLCYF